MLIKIKITIIENIHKYKELAQILVSIEEQLLDR